MDHSDLEETVGVWADVVIRVALMSDIEKSIFGIGELTPAENTGANAGRVSDFAAPLEKIVEASTYLYEGSQTERSGK